MHAYVAVHLRPIPPVEVTCHQTARERANQSIGRLDGIASVRFERERPYPSNPGHFPQRFIRASVTHHHRATRERAMTAYMVVQVTITDEEQFGKYRAAVMPLMAEHGGKPVRGGTVERLEGVPDGRGIALFEFPSMDAIRAFWNAPEYGPVKELRRGAATLDVWAVPGT